MAVITVPETKGRKAHSSSRWASENAAAVPAHVSAKTAAAHDGAANHKIDP